MTGYAVILSIALTLGAFALTVQGARFLWELDHHRQRGRRRANASLRVGVGGAALSSLGLSSLRLRGVLLPIVVDRWPWLDILSDTGAELATAALRVLLFFSTLLIIRGIRAVLFPAADGSYNGLPDSRGARLALLFLLIFSACAAAAM